MAGSHKMALLVIFRFLLENTDEDHTANATQLQEELEKYGITENRRTIYNDIATLQDFGIDIITPERSDNRGGYYIGSREFELPELKLLVDAVQSSKFITAKKSEELITKLSALTSKAQAKQLKREVFIRNRLKTENESIFYNVDAIYEAMHADRQIRFQYGELNRSGRLVPRKNGAQYVVSPWSLTWDDDNYYLLAYDAAAGIVKHYRVDKMLKIKMAAEKREGREAFRGFDLAAFSKKTFGMYGGEDAEITLRCANRFAGVIYDRFGQEILVVPDGEEYFKVRVKVAVSPQFFGWVTGIGSGIEIVSPANVRDAYASYLRQIMELYDT